MDDYLKYYDLEGYLFREVGPRFREQGYLDALDFFWIVVWKANRAKSRIARRLLAGGYPTLDAAVRDLTAGIASLSAAEDRMAYLIRDWHLRLPIASAILTVLFPEEFTVYDVRVCDSLEAFHGLADIVRFERLWMAYTQYTEAVRKSAPGGLSLRDKDRYLWGKSRFQELEEAIRTAFHASP